MLAEKQSVEVAREPRRKRRLLRALLACSLGLGAAVACGRTTRNAARCDATTDAPREVRGADALPDRSVGANPGDAASEESSRDAATDRALYREAGADAGADAEASSDAACAPDTDFMTAARNCGACGVTCCSGEVCSLGQCAGEAPSGYTWCEIDASGPDGCSNWGHAVNPQFDPSNCGGCGVACEAGANCVLGECVGELP